MQGLQASSKNEMLEQFCYNNNGDSKLGGLNNGPVKVLNRKDCNKFTVETQKIVKFSGFNGIKV
jgi:hypothetical protein